jgi:hypothetical protein
MSSKDSDPIILNQRRPDEFMTIVTDSLAGIQYKLIVLMFLMFIFLSSSTFIDRILSNFKGATEGHEVKNWGVILQATFLVMGVIAADALIKNNML